MELDQSKLQKLIKQKEVIEARIKKAKALDSKRKRQALTKIKILIGAYMLNRFEHGNVATIKTYQEKLKPFLTRENEKALVMDHLDALIKEKESKNTPLTNNED